MCDARRKGRMLSSSAAVALIEIRLEECFPQTFNLIPINNAAVLKNKQIYFPFACSFSK